MATSMLSAINIGMSANAPGGDSDCRILQLPDDCIYEIFKHLRVIDWGALGNTCTRLRHIADYCYEKDTKVFQFNGEYLLGDRSRLTLVDARKFACGFGHMQSRAVIDAHAFGFGKKGFSELLPSMDTHWTALTDLKLVMVHLNANVAERKCGRLFSSLERLVIDKSLDGSRAFDTCLMHCEQLKELKLIQLYIVKVNGLAQAFPSLESFSIQSCEYDHYTLLQEFISKNPQLKKLKFIDCKKIDRIFPQIADHVPNLESLSLWMGDVSKAINKNLMQLLKLTKLTKLEMNWDLEGIGAFFNGLVVNHKLESLLLSSVDITEDSIQLLCRLKTLKVLKFSATIQKLDKKVMQLLATGLPLVNEFHILGCATTTFDELQEFVDHSVSLNKLVYLHDRFEPSLNKQQFLHLVESRKKKVNGLALNVYLRDDDHRHITKQSMRDGYLEILQEHVKIVKLLPIEEDDQSTATDFDCCESNWRYAAQAPKPYDDIKFGVDDVPYEGSDDSESLDEFIEEGDSDDSESSDESSDEEDYDECFYKNK